MNGKDMWEFFYRLVGGVAENDRRYVYSLFNTAACDFIEKTRCLTGEAVIETVVDQQRYLLPTGFFAPRAKSPRERRIFGKYTDSDDKVSWPVMTSYEKIYYADESDSKERPSAFCVVDRVLSDPVSGAITTEAEVSGGEILVIDSGAEFSGAVYPGDTIRSGNMSGVVLSVDSGTQLTVALFRDTELADDTGVIQLSVDDTYTVFSQARYDVMLDAPSKTGGESLEIPYYRYPDPVYSEDGSFRLELEAMVGILHEAGYLYNISLDFDARRDGHLHAKYLECVQSKKRQMASWHLQGQRYTTRA